MKKLTSFALLLALTLTPVLGFAKEHDNASKSKNDRNHSENNLCIKAFGQFVKNGWKKDSKGELTISVDCKIPYGIFKKWNYIPNASSTDMVAPTINSFTVSPSVNKAEVRWSANENVRAVLFYGTTTPNVVKATTTSNRNILASVYTTNGQTLVDNTFVSKNGEVSVKNLVSGTTYYAVLAVRDSAGNVTVSNAITFTTTSNSDVTAPVISNIVTSISLNKLFVNWKTNEPATSKIFYGTSTVNVNASTTQSMSSNTLKTNHSFELIATASTTPYHVILQATDAVGNVQTSAEYSIYSPF